MQLEKAVINDRLRFSKVTWKFRVSGIYNFAVIYPSNLLYFVFFAYKQNFLAQQLKTETAMNVKSSVFVICVEAITFLFCMTKPLSIPRSTTALVKLNFSFPFSPLFFNESSKIDSVHNELKCFVMKREVCRRSFHGQRLFVAQLMLY